MKADKEAISERLFAQEKIIFNMFEQESRNKEVTLKILKTKSDNNKNNKVVM